MLVTESDLPYTVGDMEDNTSHADTEPRGSEDPMTGPTSPQEVAKARVQADWTRQDILDERIDFYRQQGWPRPEEIARAEVDSEFSRYQ